MGFEQSYNRLQASSWRRHRGIQRTVRRTICPACGMDSLGRRTVGGQVVINLTTNIATVV